MVECAFDECNNTFDPAKTRQGQKYCSVSCTRKANNKRGLERYYKRKEMIASGERRECKSPHCKTIVRRTSESEYCDPCINRSRAIRRDEIRSKILGTNK